MKVSLKTAFSILDGRMSTNMDDIYSMLNFVFDDDFMTHQLPSAFEKLKVANPKWFDEAKQMLEGIKVARGTDDFKELMAILDDEYPHVQVELGKMNEKVGKLEGLEGFSFEKPAVLT